MSTSEIKASIDRMSDDEKFFAAAYLHHISQQRDSTYRSTLADRMNRMDAGQKRTLEQANRVHQALEKEGL